MNDNIFGQTELTDFVLNLGTERRKLFKSINNHIERVCLQDHRFLGGLRHFLKAES